MCKCCFGPLEDESCGWPKGTVRAIIALLTISLGFVASSVIMVVLVIKKQYTIALGVNSVIWGVIGTIIGHYFGSKQAEGAAKMISKTEHELIESRNKEIDKQNTIPSGYNSVSNNPDSDLNEIVLQ
jgi:hypothetical protein